MQLIHRIHTSTWLAVVFITFGGWSAAQTAPQYPGLPSETPD